MFTSSPIDFRTFKINKFCNFPQLVSYSTYTTPTPHNMNSTTSLLFLILLSTTFLQTTMASQWQSLVASTRGLDDKSVPYNTLNTIKNFLDADAIKDVSSQHWLTMTVELRAYIEGIVSIILISLPFPVI